MAESASQIEWDIAAERKALVRILHALEDKAKALADWRTHYHNHPLALIGVAMGAGATLGALVGGRDTNRDWSEPSDRAAAFTRTPRSSPSTLDLRGRIADTWEHIADALLGVAAAQAIRFVSDMVPGFGEEYAARHPHAGGTSGYSQK